MNGFGFIDAAGSVVPVPTRRHLALPYVQSAQREAGRSIGTKLRCCCGGGELEVFRVPGLAPTVYDVRRRSTRDPHAPDCFARELGFFMERPRIVYAATSFDAPCAGPSPSAATGAPGRGQARHASFTHFAHQHFARASLRAFREANAGKTYRNAGLRSFTVEELHAAIAHGLAAAELSQGEPLVAALAARERSLCWGVTSAPLAQVLAAAKAAARGVEVLLQAVRAPERARPESRYVRIPRLVVERAGISCTGFHRPISAPYWFFLVLDSRPQRAGAREIQVATRLVVFPVAGSSAPFAVDSEFERQVILKLSGEGRAFLKPKVHYALGELGARLWPFGLLPTGRLPHRPDLILYSRSRCWLVELAGFDDDPDYLALVDRRLAAMISTAGHPDVRPHRKLRKDFLAEIAAAAKAG